MKVLIAGDFCQHLRVNDAIKQKKYGVIFDRIKSTIELADYSIVNFEFPIVLESTMAFAIPKCGPNLQGTIEAIEAVKYAGFSCCTLANNHILDQGASCCLATKHEIEESGIDTVGAGENIKEAELILYKEINGEKLAVINCCEHEFSIAGNKTAGSNPLNPPRQFYKIQEAKKNADYVLVIVHGGHELYNLPSPRMIETYRFFIDAGADAVVNHHQHVYSGYEVYNGKPIFYGLGNFVFDSTSAPADWNDGYMVMLETTGGSYDVIPYKQCEGNIFIRPLLKDEETIFCERINKLNNLISNDEDILTSFEEYIIRYTKDMKVKLSPYDNVYLQEAAIRGILPSFVSQKKILEILNYIECEAHRDLFIGSLKY